MQTKTRTKEEKLSLRDKVILKHGGNPLQQKLKHIMYERNVRI